MYKQLFPTTFIFLICIYIPIAHIKVVYTAAIKINYFYINIFLSISNKSVEELRRSMVEVVRSLI